MPDPELSWTVKDAPVGWQQRYYELETHGSIEPAYVRVESEVSEFVAWPFPPVGDDDLCEVRVRVTGWDGVVSAWSVWRRIGAVDPADNLEDQAQLLSGRDFWSTQATDSLRSIVLADGPHGVRRQELAGDSLGLNESLPATCFPTGTALASSWDRALFREVGTALGHEARAARVNVLLGPAINIKRSPLNGRNFEYLAEDPYLTGELASEYVRGVQGTGVGASVKHFAVNNQETGRMNISADVDDRALREIYLRAFETVVRDTAPATVMCSYNAINGVPASQNRWLLTEVLREQWGFDGLVVSDWGAVKDRVAALEAGLDLEMPSSNGEGAAEIVAAVRDGRLERELVDVSAARLARLVQRTDLGNEVEIIDIDAHHALARRAAAGSVVLLRNENATLPLGADLKLAVIGDFALNPRFQGGGSSHVNPTRIDVPLEELRAVHGAENVSFAPGYGDGDAAALRAEAARLAGAADVAIVFVGLDEAAESEGFDREHIDLPADHIATIDEVSRHAARTVVVLAHGGVVSLEPWHDRVDAIIEGWALGQAVGGAIADVLTGAVNPSGRLNETVPLALSDTPSYLHFPGGNGHVRYGEGVFVGYRYYESAARAVRYPFGHGLSYTTFVYDHFEVEATAADHARVTVSVRNAGPVAGGHVVQVYAAPAPTPVRRPDRELVAFEKVYLEPGASVDVTFELDRRSFAYWDETGNRWMVQPGRYELQLAASAHDIVDRRVLPLDGDQDQTGPLGLDSTVKEWFGHPVVGVLLTQRMSEGMTQQQRAEAEKVPDALKMVESMPMAQFVRFPGIALTPELLQELIDLSGAQTPSPTNNSANLIGVAS